jgi:hypothetical protein
VAAGAEVAVGVVEEAVAEVAVGVVEEVEAVAVAAALRPRRP